jgi:hypothetical protein
VTRARGIVPSKGASDTRERLVSGCAILACMWSLVSRAVASCAQSCQAAAACRALPCLALPRSASGWAPRPDDHNNTSSTVLHRPAPSSTVQHGRQCARSGAGAGADPAGAAEAPRRQLAGHDEPRSTSSPEPRSSPRELALTRPQLISSGKYIQTAKQAPESSRPVLKRNVSVGCERYHDLLDELETEIRLAQTVLRRDLAQMRAQRKEKEAAAKQKEAEKARLATESKSIPPPPKEEVAPSPVPAKPASPAPAVAPAPAPAPTPVKAEPVAPIKVEPLPEKAPTPEPKVPTPPPADVPMDNTDSLGGMQESEFDFDAMFGDSAMDTSGDAANEQDDLNLDAEGDLDFTLDEQPSDGLLRGLEDFAKDGPDDTAGQNNASALDLDYNMADMADMNVDPPQQQQPATTMTETPKQEETLGQQATTTDEVNLETLTTDNLDDLFDLDYENPEATQFDDAFFGFDEN